MGGGEKKKKKTGLAWHIFSNTAHSALCSNSIAPIKKLTSKE